MFSVTSPPVIVMTYHGVVMANLQDLVCTEILANMPTYKHLKEVIVDELLDPEKILLQSSQAHTL